MRKAEEQAELAREEEERQEREAEEASRRYTTALQLRFSYPRAAMDETSDERDIRI